MLSSLILFAQVLTTPSPVGPSSCARALQAVPTARACAMTQFGVVLADTQAEADGLMADAMTGERRFAAVFGRDPSRYAVFAFADPAAIPAARMALLQLGATAILPVPSAGFLASQRERAAASMKTTVGGGQVVVRKQPASGDEPRDSTHELIPHELGHRWYAQTLWADAPRPTADRYGSAAPDWLDEVAAMLMESDGRADIHRYRFADGRSADAERAATIPPEIPLAQLVTMAHPASASLAAASQAAGPIRVTSAPSLFYAEARVFADYLIERSADAHIFAAISEGMRDGSTFAEWVARSGAGHRLPTTLAAMDADWQKWLVGRYGPPA